MKKILSCIVCVLLLASNALAIDDAQILLAKIMLPIMGASEQAAGDYCSGTSWQTFTDFRYDADHTDNSLNSCLDSASETETFTTNETPTVQSPSYTTPSESGGDIVEFDSDDERIISDNTDGYHASAQGEMRMKFIITGNNDENMYIWWVYVDNDNRQRLYILDTGEVYFFVEGTNQGSVAVQGEHSATGLDIDDYPGEMIEVHIIWDASRCSAEPCDQAGEEEIAIRFRVDDGKTGSWTGPGASGNDYWSDWAYESDTDNYTAFSSEATTNDILVGLNNGASQDVDNVTLEVDDLQVKNTAPSAGYWP